MADKPDCNILDAGGGVCPRHGHDHRAMAEEQAVEMSEGFFYVEWTGAPCPWCASAGVSGKSPAGHFFAGCPDGDCLAHNLAYDFVTVDHARAAWNSRTPSSWIERDV